MNNHSPLTHEIDVLEREQDSIVTNLMSIPVLSPEWDLWIERYKIISLKICLITGKVFTCDSIVY